MLSIINPLEVFMISYLALREAFATVREPADHQLKCGVPNPQSYEALTSTFADLLSPVKISGAYGPICCGKLVSIDCLQGQAS